MIGAVALAACGSNRPPVDPIQHRAEAEPAVRALQRGDFAGAGTEAERALGRDDRNSTAAAVHALATYQRAGARFRDELMAVIDGGPRGPQRGFDHPRARKAWNEFASALVAVDRDLEIAARDPGFSLELCLACWEHDWNHSGGIDDSDRKLFQVEVDTKGEELPENDPRRTPTFRFDRGDIDWARAMIAFQRALSELILAYRWEELDRVLRLDLERPLVIRLEDAGRVRRARELILAGLAFSDRSRELYLAETDDQREWVPNPRQRDHAVPLQMDAAIYETWAGVTRDLRALIDGKEALPITPGVLLNVRTLLEQPRDITIDVKALDGSGDDKLQRLLRGLFGTAIVKDLPRSPLVQRVERMKSEIDRDEDTFDRKLRYFLWIN